MENVIAAAALAQHDRHRVKFVLIGDGNQRRTLQCDASGVANVQFLESVSEEQFPAALGAADILLVNERPGVSQMSVPSKLTSYFRAGKPVIAAVDPDGHTASEVTASRAGVCIPPDRPDLLLDEVLRIAGDHRLRQVFAENGMRYSSTLLRDDLSLESYETWIQSLVEYRLRA